MEGKERGVVPRKIKGFRDINASLNSIRWHIIESASKVYRSYGFEHLDTPILEYADALGKYMPDSDTVDRGVYSFKNPEIEPVYQANGRELRDQDNKVVMDNHFLSLRYDLTAPLSRVYAERMWTRHLKGAIHPGKAPLFRRYQFGPVFRFETKLDPGRFREFWQLDFDSVGSNNIASDAEVCMILSEALQAIGLDKTDFRIKVNNRKILKGLLLDIGVEKEEEEQAILRIVDKLDKIGRAGVEAELGKGRKDKSGAVIPGLGLDPSRTNRIIGFIETFAELNPSRTEVLEELSSKIGNNEISKAGLEELEQIDRVLKNVGMNGDVVYFTPSLVRGMAYYTGPIFEVESTQSYTDEKGIERRVGSICGGGRYDGLVENLLGLKAPASGASIGVDRLAELMMLTGKSKGDVVSPVLITVLDQELMPEYQKIAAQLRRSGVDTEIYYGPNPGFKKLKKQLSYADKKGCPVALMLGGNELEKGVITVRNLKLGSEIADTVTDKGEWRRLTQSEVNLKDLVTHVNSIL